MTRLPAPHGGSLVNLLASPDRQAALRAESLRLPSIDLDWHQIDDLEMLLCGGYSPLRGYMVREDYENVLEKCALKDGTAWPVPITLRLTEKQVSGLQQYSRVALRDGEGFLLAVLTVADKWQADVEHDQRLLQASPLPDGVAIQTADWHVGGELEGISLPVHHDFAAFRRSPASLRAELEQQSWQHVIGWLASQPMHRAQHDFCQKTCKSLQGGLLLLPFGGGDLTAQTDYYTLLRTYQKLLPRFSPASTRLAMLPIQAVGSGMREKLMRVVLARNYGCTHIVLGGEHLPEGRARRGTDLTQGRFDLMRVASTLGVTVVPYPRLRYVPARGEYLPEEEIPEHAEAAILTGEEFASRMQRGEAIPEWYAFPEVLAEMHRAHPPRERLGFTVFFTGLSGAGKSTLARALASRLMELGGRPVTLLDGDIVRRHLSSELGFSRAHRDINVRRIGFVASEITKNRGVAICAPIAPYRQTRRAVRAMVEAVGGFIEVYMATPIETCEARDRKGLYAKARSGQIPEFTGVSDPYEQPEQPEIRLDTTDMGVDEAIHQIMQTLVREGYVKLPSQPSPHVVEE